MFDAQPQPAADTGDERSKGPLHDLEVLNTIHRMSDGTGLSLHERLSAIVKIVAFHMRSDACSIYLEEGNGNGAGIVLAATHGLNPEAVGRVSLAVGEGVSGWVARERIPLPIEDIQNDVRFKVVGDMGEEGFRAIMAAPIRLDQRLIGVINVQSREVHSYADSQVRLLETIGIHLGGIIRAAQYYEDAKKQLKHQRLINGIGQALVSTLHLDPLLEMVMDKSREITNTRGGVLRLWDDEVQQLVVRVQTGERVPDKELKPLYLGEGMAGIAALKQERQRLDAINKPPQKEMLPAGISHNYLCVPVVYQGRGIGTISVFDKESLAGESCALTADDETLMQALANQVAVAIENARQCDDLTAAVAVLKQGRDQQVQCETLDAVARMADSVVHQIKTPMVPIQGLAKRLMDEGLSGEQRQNYLEAMLRETRKVDRFLEGVSGLVEADRVCQQHRDVDAFVSELVERLRPEASAQGVALRLNLEAETAVYLDSERLRRALGHLLDNAINALPTGGEVNIGTKRCAYPVEGMPVDGVCICVRDNGLGIDETQMADLFKPFVSGRDNGLGLGLATAYRTVRAHGGLLLAHNPPEGGAAFTLFLPDFPELPDAPRRPNRQ